jgi:hypothetical protein
MTSADDARPMPPNPKQVFGDAKIPLSLVSSIAIAEECLACLEGNLKYGLVNYRGSPVEVMTYIKAGERHRRLFMEGEDRDPLTGVHHLAYSRACDGIILDAMAHGTAIDNRPLSGAYNSDYLAKLAVTVLRIRELYGDKNPKHYTIADKATVRSP